MKISTEKVEKIVEKPKIFVGNKINTGISLLNPSIHSRELVVLEWGVLDILVQEEFY
ncbi:hypothetical protein Peur_071359 [Populus x canadensis]